MAIITAKNQLSEIIISHPETIPLINRFGISLGTGDKSIENICNEHGLDYEFFATILNTYINEDFFPEKTLKTFQAKTIIDYISKTYAYYTHYMIPNVERHFHLLISKSGGNNNLDLMLQFFNETKRDIINSIEHDTKNWFPLILSLDNSNNNSAKHFTPHDSAIIEDKISDLKNMFIIHLTGNYELNLCYAVISSIIALEKDLRQNNRIRNRILALIYRNLTLLQ